MKNSGTQRVAIIGAGKVGTAMGSILAARSYNVTKVCDVNDAARDRAEKLLGVETTDNPAGAARGADIVLVTTPDGVIEQVCRKIAQESPPLDTQKFIHMSGALSLDALSAAAEAGADTLTIHPIQTFADFSGAVRALPGSTFGVTCAPSLEQWARDFVGNLEGRVLFVKDSDRVLYHAAATIACNLMTMVEYGAYGMIHNLFPGEVGAWEAFVPLINATLENIERLGPAAALTGPLSRGDTGTIEAHLEALGSFDPALAAMYRAVSLWGLKAVRERGELGDEKIEEMRSLLEGHTGGSC